MVVEDKTENMPKNYVLRKKGGRNIVERKPVIGPDEESLYVIVENTVRVYNIHTGDLIRVLKQESDDSNLIAIEFLKDESHNLYGFSENGIVTVWTSGNGVVLRDKQLKIAEKVILLTFNLVHNEQCFITGYDKYTGKLYHALYSLETGTLIYNFGIKMTIAYVNIISVAIACDDQHSYVAICNGSKNLFIEDLKKRFSRNVIKNSNGVRILSVTARPGQLSFLTTDALGRATLISGNLFPTNEGGQATECMHWHHLPLFAATFTSTGSYVITGGMEKVLVKWILGSLAEKPKQLMFVPRLPGTVKYITASTSYVVVSLSNNSIIVVDQMFHLTTTILECGGLSQAARTMGSTLTFLKPLNSLVFGGRPGHLQLYSTISDTVLHNIDITQQNDIPPTRANLIPLNTEVTCVGANANGNWLVTSEYRNDDKNYTEEKLKFWMASKHEHTPFTLTTCVNLSHGGCKVISIALDTAGTICVSAGDDEKFRIWTKEKANSDRNKPHWTCLTACYYSSGVGHSLSHDILNKFKSFDHSFDPSDPSPYPYLHKNVSEDVIYRVMSVKQIDSKLKDEDVNGVLDKVESDMGGVAVSNDGSLIAAWFGCKLTLWDSQLCTLRTTLSHVALRPRGIHVQFGNKDASHYLVCTTQSCLAVWSLLSLSIKWIVSVEVTCLTACTITNKMAITTTKNDIIVFTPHSSKPVLLRKNVLKTESGILKYCAFGISNVHRMYKIYIMRNDCELYCLEPEQDRDNKLEIISHKNIASSYFSMMVAEHQTSDIIEPKASTKPESTPNEKVVRKAVLDYLSAPAHMMPSLSILSVPFLEQVSGRSEIEEVPLESMEVDQESNASDDDEPEVEMPLAEVPKAKQLWTVDYEEVKEKRLKKIWKQSDMDGWISNLYVKSA